MFAAYFAIATPLGAQPTPQPLPLAAVTPAGSSLPVRWSHVYASFGEPKYPSGFVHFDYVNPDAPKGGTLYLRNPDRRTNFDKFNDFTLQGNAPAGLTLLMLESLAERSADEPQTMYGLLAEAMSVAPDKSSISFRLHPKARFSNGQPVTAADVKRSNEHGEVSQSKVHLLQMREVSDGQL